MSDRQQYQDAFDEAQSSFLKKKGVMIADLAGALWIPPALEFSYINLPLSVNHHTGDITPDVLTFDEKIICYQYLAEASGVSGPGDGQISFLQLPQGEHHYEPFLKETVNLLTGVFGNKPELFLEAGLSLGGSTLVMGDAAFSLPVFPKIRMDFAIWQGDEEFPPRANILFDSKADFHLTTATLYMLGIAVSQRLAAFRGGETADSVSP